MTIGDDGYFRYSGDCRSCGKTVQTVTRGTASGVVWVRCADCRTVTTAPEWSEKAGEEGGEYA